MTRLIKNIVLFIIAIFLLVILGTFGLIFTCFISLIDIKNTSIVKYWGDFFYTINVGIDKLGNVLLGKFMNSFAVKNQIYQFGNLNDTISFCLAKNSKNLTVFGKIIVKILEYIDPGHMQNSIENRI